MSGWALSWQLTTKPGVAAVVTKTTPSDVSITGTFNASPALNTQRIIVTLLDDDTAGLPATTYWHELKRTDAGLEEVLAHGSLALQQPVHP